MLQSIHLRGFRSLHDVRIEPARLTIVTGAPGSGRSAVLDGLTLPIRLAGSATLGDALGPQPLASFFAPGGDLAVLREQDHAALRVEARFTTAAQLGLLYRVAIRIDTATGAATVDDEFLARLEQDRPRVPRIAVEDGEILVRRLGASGEPVTEPLGLGHTVASEREYGDVTRYPEIGHLATEVSSWRVVRPDLQALAARRPPARVQSIGTDGANLSPWLLQAATAHPPLLQELAARLPRRWSIDRVTVTVDAERRVQVTVTAAGVERTLQQLSDVERVAIAIAAAATDATVLAIDGLDALAGPELAGGTAPTNVVADLTDQLIELAADGRQILLAAPEPLAASLAAAAAARPVPATTIRCQYDGNTTAVTR